jgi:capsular exopolysaccharide synthesis family protein
MAINNVNPAPSNPTSAPSIDLPGIMRRKFWTIAFFTLVAIGLAILYYFKAPKIFESNSKIYVHQNSAPTLTADAETLQAEIAVERDIEIIRSSRVLATAIEQGKLDEMESMEDVEPNYHLFELRDRLVVKPSDAAGSAIDVIYRCGNADDAKHALTHILLAFKQDLQNDNQATGGLQVSTTLDLKKNLEDQLVDNEKLLRELSAKPHLQFDGDVMTNQHQAQQVKIQENRDEIRRDIARLKARLEQFVAAEQTGTLTDSMIIDALADFNDSSLSGYVSANNEYMRLKIEEKEKQGQFGVEHPDMIALRNQILMVDQMRMRELAALRGGDSSSGPIDLLSVVSEQIRYRIELKKAEDESLREEMQQEQGKAMRIAQDVEMFATLKSERDTLQAELARVTTQLTEFNTMQAYSSRELKTLNPPSKPEQYSPSLLFALPIGLMLGSLTGLMFCILKEMAEKTFRSSDEIARQLGVPVIAHIVYFANRGPKAPEHKNVAADLVTVHRPTSVASEAFKALRTSVFFKANQSDAKVIQITSPSPADGKSTVAANLAATMAQSGRSVVLIDCDLRKPTQHHRFGLQNEVGFSNLLTGELQVAEVVQDPGIENLSLITSGPQFSNPAELLTSGSLYETVHDIKEIFDFVIIDTPPVLAVTDPVIVSDVVDLVYMPMRIRTGVQVNAGQSVESLRAVGTEIEGVIINALSKKDSGKYNYGGYGGYGGYGRYGYGNQGYGYGNRTYGNISSKSKAAPLRSKTGKPGANRQESSAGSNGQPIRLDS